MVCRRHCGRVGCASATALAVTDTRRYARRVLSSRVEPSRRRVAACCVCFALIATLGGTGAPAAFAAGLGGNGALNELTEGEPEATTSTATSATTSTTETTNSHTVIFLALGAAVLLLSAIAFVIVRDARRMVPAGDPEVVERDSAHEQAVKLQRRRAKAKAARKQRKRTRQ
jgi:hypothetical protein